MKKTKKLIMGSALAIGFCASLMAGTTYALFTSESGVNVAVTSANVSIDASINEKSVQTKQLYETEWTDGMGGTYAKGVSYDAKTATITLNNFLPGDAVKFDINVVNGSSVDVQYRASWKTQNDDGLFDGLAITIDGASYDGTTTYSAWKLVKTGDALDSVEVQIELPEKADKAYNNKSCTLVFSVEAVQGNASVDNGSADVTYIYTARDLKAFADSVNAGNTYANKTVELMSDVSLAGMNWTPIGLNCDDTAHAFAGTFDGNGYTISDLKIDRKEAVYQAAGLFGALNGIAKNFTVKNAYVNALSLGNSDGNTSNGIAVVAGSIVWAGTQSGVENVNIIDSEVYGNRYVGGIAGYAYGNVQDCTVSGCTLVATPDKLTGSYDNGDKAGGIVAYRNDDTSAMHKVTGNTVKDTTIEAWRDFGGIGGCVSNNSTEFRNNKVENVTLRTGYIADYNKAHTNVNEIIGRLTSGAIDETNTATDVKILNVLADGFYNVANSKEYAVTNASGFIAWHDMIDGQQMPADSVIKLYDDIDMTGKVWSSIWAHAESKKYVGTLDGQGHVVSNFTMSGKGMFSGTPGQTAFFKNIVMDNANVSEGGIGGENNKQFRAVFIGQLYGNAEFHNVTVKNSYVAGKWGTGLLVGSLGAGDSAGNIVKIENCEMYNNTVYGLNYYIGGFVGILWEGSTLEITGKNVIDGLTIKYEAYGENNLAGYVYCDDANGIGMVDSHANVTITNCKKELAA